MLFYLSFILFLFKLKRMIFTNNKADSVKSKEIEEWIGKTKEMSYSKFCIQMKKYCVTNGKTIDPPPIIGVKYYCHRIHLFLV